MKGRNKINHANIMKIFTFIVILIIVPSFEFEFSAERLRNLQQYNYLTSTQRTANVKKNCQGIVRQQFLKDSNSQVYSAIYDYLNYLFPYDGAFITKQYLLGNHDQAKSQMQSNPAPIIFFVLPFLLALVAGLLIWPCLLCCCLCPRSKTPQCFQKYQKYSKQQLRCPLITLIALTIICLGGAIFGFVFSSSFQKTFSQARCNTAMAFDDMLNGNTSTTTDTQRSKAFYHMGINTLSEQLSILQANLGTLNNSYARVRSDSTIITKINGQIIQSSGEITNIPSITGSKAVMNYSTPIDSGATTGTISSTFPDILGISTQHTTLIGTMIDSMTGIQTILTPIKNSADNLTNHFSTAQSQLPIALSHVQQSKTRFQVLDAYYDEQFDKNNTIPQTITLGFYLLATAIIVFSLITVIGACFVFFQNSKFKPIMYCGCGLLFITGILILALSVFCALIIPAGTIGCSYANSTLSSKVNFQNNTEGLVTDQQAAVQVMQCLSSSYGDLVGQIAGIQIYTVYQEMVNLQNQMTLYEQTKQADIVQNAYISIGAKLNAVLITNYVDINDTSSIQILKRLSVSSNYACSDIDFNKDSWVPSNNQNPLIISCNIQNGNQCNSQTNFNNGCFGCMDTSLIFQTKTMADVATALQSKYSTVNCNPFITDFTNVWGNYYKKKQDYINPIKARYINTQTNAYKLINTARNQFNNLFADIKLQRAPLSEAVNTQSGFLNGTNCKVFGQDLDFLYKRTCKTLLPNIFFLLIGMAIIGYSILIISCNVVLLGVRQSHQQQVTQQVTRKYTTAKTSQSAQNIQIDGIRL